MEKSNIFLKVTGILMIIGGSFAIIAGALVLLLGVFLFTTDLLDPSQVTAAIGHRGEVSIVISILGGIVQFITGVIGVKYDKKPDKANTCILFGIITALIFLVSQAMGSAGGESVSHFAAISIVFGLLVPAFYLIGAVQLKSKK